MRRPQRDERWTHPCGDTWQITKVKTRQRFDRPGHMLAYVEARNVETGLETRVSAAGLVGWKRKDPDPLHGHRIRITNRIREGDPVFALPAELVYPGEIYHLACGVIRIDKVSEKIVTGRQNREYLVHFTRLIEERLYFLRNVTPKLKPGEKPGQASRAEAERARIDGAYSHTPIAGGDDLPAVPPDWEDPGVAERKLRQKQDAADMRAEDLARQEARRLKARVDQVVIPLGKKGVDPAEKLAPIYAQLAELEEDAA